MKVRIILDRNQNGIDGRPTVAAGASLQPGLYWDPAARRDRLVHTIRVAGARSFSRQSKTGPQ